MRSATGRKFILPIKRLTKAFDIRNAEYTSTYVTFRTLFVTVVMNVAQTAPSKTVSGRPYSKVASSSSNGSTIVHCTPGRTDSEAGGKDSETGDLGRIDVDKNKIIKKSIYVHFKPQFLTFLRLSFTYVGLWDHNS